MIYCLHVEINFIDENYYLYTEENLSEFRENLTNVLETKSLIEKI